ncbi:hypothetical protein BK749_13555 [Bacillus thuringiensis serovar vazensis]|uniref:Uncharacterized protein n=1 Tax=Bacillus thuringiensis serovar vazensis TaxID=180867 RepID=A0A243CWL5_BACTU|nr:hypothetical protein BK749_13555 [Bacillus thuringiensis serovar vazensis]
MDTFTSIFTKKFMIWLFSRVRHYLTITLRNPADKRGFFYLNNDFVLLLLVTLPRINAPFFTYHIKIHTILF